MVNHGNALTWFLHMTFRNFLSAIVTEFEKSVVTFFKLPSVICLAQSRSGMPFTVQFDFKILKLDAILDFACGKRRLRAKRPSAFDCYSFKSKNMNLYSIAMLISNQEAIFLSKKTIFSNVWPHNANCGKSSHLHHFIYLTLGEKLASWCVTCFRATHSDRHTALRVCKVKSTALDLNQQFS